jgi:hypothetical protein
MRQKVLAILTLETARTSTAAALWTSDEMPCGNDLWRPPTPAGDGADR